MAIFLINARKIGSDDISWGMATLNYTDYNGVNRHIPQVNAFAVPYTVSESVGQALDSLFGAQLDIIVVETAADFTAALTILGSDEGTIYLRRGSYTLTVDPAVPDNVRLWFENGAVINASNTTVTISGPITATTSQIFSWAGSGAFDLSGSSTNPIYLEWWGAIVGTSNDCTDAINKCFAARGGHQTVELLSGDYRITSAVTVPNDRHFRMVGLGRDISRFYIDIGGAGTGFRFGTPGSWSGYNTYLYGLAFTGDAASCEYGVRMYMHSAIVDNVRFYMGASQYALATYGMEHCYFNEIHINGVSNGPAGGMIMSKDPGSLWDNTVWHLNIHAHGGGSPGAAFSLPALKITSWVTGDISGVLEAYDEPFNISGVGPLGIHDLYIEGGGTTASLTNSSQISIRDSLFNDGGLQFVLDGCSGTNIDSCLLGDTVVNANCKGIVFGSNLMWYGKKIYDYANGSVSLGLQSGTLTSGNDNTNRLYNSSFMIWNATDSKPDKYTVSGGTFVRAGTGEADTTQHNAPYCVNVTTSAAYASFSPEIDSNQLQSFLGKTITWSTWVFVAVGETLSAVYPGVTVTVPAWGALADKNIGDGVVDTNSYMWTCIQAGTTGGVAPTWPNPPTSADQVTDGSVIWGYKLESNIGYRYNTSDQGTWRLCGYTMYIPLNATAVVPEILLYRNVANFTGYIAEPSLTIGQIVTPSFSPGHNEAYTFLQIGANKISYGTAVPASGWCQQGDVVWRTDATANQSPGWICTTSGVGGAAVWKAMANVAA